MIVWRVRKFDKRKARPTILPVVGILRTRYAYRLGKVSNYSVILRPPGAGLVGKGISLSHYSDGPVESSKFGTIN